MLIVVRLLSFFWFVLLLLLFGGGGLGVSVFCLFVCLFFASILVCGR